MMESIRGYLVLTAIFFLLFLTAAFLFGRYKKKKHSFAKANFQFLKKVPWDTIIKGLAAAGFILFSRRLIYYVHFDGVIQTKFSIWWMDENAQTLLFVSISIFFTVGYVVKIFTTDIKKKGCLSPLLGLVAVAVIWSVVINSLFEDMNIKLPITVQHLILIVFSPLLELKMLCSGKYLGLLTSFLVGYFMAAGYEKIKPGIRKPHVKIMIVAAVMFIIFLGFGFYKALENPVNWEKQLNNKVHVVSDETDMMELLEAVHSIDREQARYQSLEQIAAFIVKEKQFRWKKEIYQLVIDAILSYDGHRRGNLLEKIALWIAANGDVPWAKEVAMSIRDKTIRNNVLKELREKIEVK